MHQDHRRRSSPQPSDLVQHGDIIKSRWTITRKIGHGGFGQIYETQDSMIDDEVFAIKIESAQAHKPVLKMESAVLRRLQDRTVHVCKFIGCGRNEMFNYVVMTLQGQNLSELRRTRPYKPIFSLSTSLRLCYQMIDAIEAIHDIGFLHRDIKPSNFAVGLSEETRSIVYMLDFGLARQYVSTSGEVYPPRHAAPFRGTPRYASFNAHRGKELGRGDDLWSVFYILVEFQTGALPWRKIRDKDQVGRMKEIFDHRALLKHLPPEMGSFLDHLEDLSYESTPDYSLLRHLFDQVMIRKGISFNDPYDWQPDRRESDSIVTPITTTSTGAGSAPTNATRAPTNATMAMSADPAIPRSSSND